MRQKQKQKQQHPKCLNHLLRAAATATAAATTSSLPLMYSKFGANGKEEGDEGKKKKAFPLPLPKFGRPPSREGISLFKVCVRVRKDSRESVIHERKPLQRSSHSYREREKSATIISSAGGPSKGENEVIQTSQ